MDQRVAVVTGGADGIGKEISRQLLTNGHVVAALDINEATLNATAAEFKTLGIYLPIQANVSEEDSTVAAIKQVLAAFGRIDVLVNNAGGSMAVSQEIEKIAASDWDKVINVNLRGTFLCTKAVLPTMKQRKWGRIVNLSSMAGRGRSLFGGTPYAAAKAGIIGFTRQGSKELGKYNITLNSVAPGLVISGPRISDYWYNKKTEEERNHFLNLTPMNRPGQPQDIAGVVLFLCSDAASYITGAVIDINGGVWVG
jgi:3-oxoacyl-[acyl-carrier protein] reductase